LGLVSYTVRLCRNVERPLKALAVNRGLGRRPLRAAVTESRPTNYVRVWVCSPLGTYYALFHLSSGGAVHEACSQADGQPDNVANSPDFPMSRNLPQENHSLRNAFRHQIADALRGLVTTPAKLHARDRRRWIQFRSSVASNSTHSPIALTAASLTRLLWINSAAAPLHSKHLNDKS
jgi:hypothetical protein